MKLTYFQWCSTLGKTVPFYLVNLTCKYEWLGPTTHDLTLRCIHNCPQRNSCPNTIYHTTQKFIKP